MGKFVMDDERKRNIWTFSLNVRWKDQFYFLLLFVFVCLFISQEIYVLTCVPINVRNSNYNKVDLF